MNKTVKVVYSAFMAMDDSDKKEFFDYIENLIESEPIFQAMQQGDQTKLTEKEMIEMMNELKQ